MKKAIAIIVFGLLWCNTSFALTKSQIFKPNKNIDVEKLLNFNINKYTFDDYEKIIGKKFRKWDGKSELRSFTVDYKTIDILFKNEKGVLSLQKTKNNRIFLALVVQKIFCETLKSSIPAKFINKNNTIDYERDLLGLKDQIYEFSHDLPGDIRIHVSCSRMYDSDEKSEEKMKKKTDGWIANQNIKTRPNLFKKKRELTKEEQLRIENYIRGRAESKRALELWYILNRDIVGKWEREAENEKWRMK